MKNENKKGKSFSRRGIFPILGTSLLLPFFGMGNSVKHESTSTEDEEYETLLKPDGTIVKVKRSALKKSKTVQKNMSNSSLLSWLGKKS